MYLTSLWPLGQMPTRVSTRKVKELATNTWFNKIAYNIISTKCHSSSNSSTSGRGEGLLFTNRLSDSSLVLSRRTVSSTIDANKSSLGCSMRSCENKFSYRDTCFHGSYNCLKRSQSSNDKVDSSTSILIYNLLNKISYMLCL